MMAAIKNITHQIMTNTIDLTGDSEEEYYWPIHRSIRKRKLTKFYTPEDKICTKKKETTPKCSSRYVGSRVAKYFGDELYLGSVAFIDDYCHIVYDDGDEEDVGSDELQVLIQLYHKEGRRLELSTESDQTKEPDSISISTCQSKGTTLFDIYNISRNQIESVRTLIPRQHQDRVKQISEFFLLCYERQRIWQRKRAGLKELTRDPKMAKNFYCNVYRELDRGTQYFRANLMYHRSRADGKFDLEEVLWDSLCYRLVNKIETFEKFGRIPKREEFKQFARGTFQTLWENETVVFTSAHQCMGKDRYIATMESLYKKDGRLIKKLASSISSAKDLQTCYKVLLQVDNVGKFFAWQVLCDLLEAKVIPFNENDWVKLGPGAVGGLKAVFGKAAVKSADFVPLTKLLHGIQDQVYRALGLTFPKFMGREITLKNIEHALCEFCKYTNGHVMRRYCLGGKGSRTHHDIAKCCHVCGTRYNTDLSKLCDLCRTGYCGTCCDEYGREVENAWLCLTCIEIEDE
jgi:hypothetical protein